MVTVNAGGLAEGMFESELFGHVKGAFTDAKMDRVGRFELADGGTLFLDEIANVPLNLQAKLLRVLETGEMERVGSSKTQRVDVRVISATNADLAEEVAAGRFRAGPAVPPEHDRDPSAAAARAARRYPAAGVAFPAACTRSAIARSHGFDAARHAGSARQSVAGQCPRTESCDRARGADGQGQWCGSAIWRLRSGPAAPRALEDMSLEEVEAFLIKKALARYNGNVSHAANALGLSRSALVPAPAALRTCDDGCELRDRTDARAAHAAAGAGGGSAGVLASMADPVDRALHGQSPVDARRC